MNQMLIDYERTLAVIRSCKTNAQNQVAYRMVHNFHSKHKDDGQPSYTLELFAVCDLNLQQICGGYGGLPK